MRKEPESTVGVMGVGVEINGGDLEAGRKLS